MSGKTIFIIIVSVLVTIILMNNTDPIDFWLFGIVKIPKLVVLGTMFGLGFIIGAIAARPRKKKVVFTDEDGLNETKALPKQDLSDEDRNYIN